jgi:hypothetical protein
MDKNTLLTFIRKYSCGNVIESVKYSIKDNVLKTSFIAEDKTLAGAVSVEKFTFEDCEFGIFDTTKLRNFLKVLDDDITVTLNKVGDIANSITLSDKNLEVTFMLSDLSVIPSAPKVKEIKTFDVEIPIDSEFVNRFVKAKNALPDVDSFTLLMNKKGDKLELVIGYASINSNRIKVDVKASIGKDKLEKPISFNANYFRDVLSENNDCTGAVLKVAAAGIALIEFKNTDFVSTYYLIQKKIEG